MTCSLLKAVGAVALVVALLAAAGCGGDDTDADRTLTRPADLPAAEQVAKDNSVVRAEDWGVVRAPHSDTATDVIAIKVTSMDKGEVGALKDVQVMNAAGGGRDMATAVPYYISYDFAVISGSRFSSPSQLLYASTASGTDNLDSLSVPEGVDKCRTPRDVNNYPSDVGYAMHGCLTVAAHGGAVPTQVVFDAGSAKGSRRVKFQLSAAGAGE